MFDTEVMATPRTLFQKIWDEHVVTEFDSGEVLLYIDRHLIHEVTSPQAFEGLRARGLRVRAPELNFAVADHNVPTLNRSAGVDAIEDPESRLQVETLARNARDFGIRHIELTNRWQGIVHVIGPELGLTLPGTTVVCGDSHTSTHGAFGALAFGIGTSEIEHVLATQTLVQKRPETMLIQVNGRLPASVSAKDLILHIIGTIGTAGATGHVVEYAGTAIEALDVAGRMTLCNMTIEAGARSGLIAPDTKAIDWLRSRPFAPSGELFEAAEEQWTELKTDPGSKFSRTVSIDPDGLAPMVTWGTNPEAVIPVTGRVPEPDAESNPALRAQLVRMLDYMDLKPGQAISGVPIDVAFIGSCTNARIEDLRAAAQVASGRRVARGVQALVVPGSGLVKAQAEKEGLDRIFVAAGFEWRDAGCSMCIGLNPDRLQPAQRCASTSNRNFEGRQGPGGRTHLMSPAMATAAALAGEIIDARSLA